MLALLLCSRVLLLGRKPGRWRWWYHHRPILFSEHHWWHGTLLIEWVVLLIDLRCVEARMLALFLTCVINDWLVKAYGSILKRLIWLTQDLVLLVRTLIVVLLLAGTPRRDRTLVNILLRVEVLERLSQFSSIEEWWESLVMIFTSNWHRQSFAFVIVWLFCIWSHW